MAIAKTRYPKPKILLVDASPRWASVLRGAGFTVEEGTFGAPYEVPQSTDLLPVPLNASLLPNCEEQEIVIIDLEEVMQQAPPPQRPSDGIVSWWQSCSTGVVDPRYLAMKSRQRTLDRILNHGGVVVFLLSNDKHVRYLRGHVSYDRFNGTSEETLSLSECLTDLSRVEFSNSEGEEISFVPGPLSTLLKGAVADMHHRCTIEIPQWLRRKWTSVALNKYRRPVAGILGGEHGGTILFLPQMPSLGNVITRLVGEWAAEVAPSLFPHIEHSRWIYRSPYELPIVSSLNRDVEDIRSKADADIAEKMSQIDQLHVENKDYYTLLTGTGRDLVLAVIRVMSDLGFQKIVDVDAEVTGASDLREDVQIHDKSPTLVIDIKGVNGRPEDAECQQAEKHTLIRVREWKRADVSALTLINSERHMPPLDRDRLAFRDEMIKNAEHTKSGLMTTVDLAFLWRNAKQHGWKPDVLLPVFYGSGRIVPMPTNFTAVGRIVKKWRSAFGIVPSHPIENGSVLAIRRDMDVIVLTVESIRVDDNECEVAPAGSNCGIGTSLSGELAEGLEVFVVEPEMAPA